MRRVVVTGVGAISPIGIGAKSFWENLLAGKVGVRRVSLFDPGGFPSQVVGEVPACAVLAVASCGDNEPDPIAPRSGSRLELVEYDYGNGIRELDRDVLFDRELGLDCRAVTFSDGARYCLPEAADGLTRFVDAALYWIAYLHFGRINGIGIPCDGPGLCDQTTKAVWALVGALPAAMYVTGVVMWWNRVVRRWLRTRESARPMAGRQVSGATKASAG
jgi:hypothetical protein